MWSRGVRMPERATGGDAVADELFDLLDFRKAAPLLPRPDELVINAHLKDATGPIRGERHGAELLGKRGQQLLRHPAGPQAPAAQSAIGDLDHGADGHSCLPVRWVSALVSTSTDGANSPARRFYRLANVRARVRVAGTSRRGALAVLRLRSVSWQLAPCPSCLRC